MSGTRDQGNILGTMPVDRLVLTMSAPIMISMLVSAVYNLVDSIYVAQVSDLDFLALSYAYPVQLMMVAFCTGIGVGFNATFAQRLGEGKREEANRVACHGFLFYTLCWLLFLAFALFGAPLFFRLSTGDPAVARAGVQYLTICCGASIGMCMQFLTERLLQTTGHPAGFMIVQGSGAVLNIVLDPVFIFGLDMGVAGAAVATVIGQISGACIGFFLLWRIRREFSVSFRGFRPSRVLSGEMLRIAAPAVVMQSLSSFMSLGLNQLLTLWSQTGVFVLGVYFKIQTFVFMPIFGVSNGLIPILSYNYGAKNVDRVKSAFKLLLKVSLTYSVFLWLCVMIFPQVFAGMFTSDATLLAFTAKALRIYLACLFMFGIQIACQMTFTSIGRAKASIIVAVMRKFILLIPLIYIMPEILHSNQTMAVYMAEPIADFLAVTFTAVLFFFEFRKALRELFVK